MNTLRAVLMVAVILAVSLPLGCSGTPTSAPQGPPGGPPMGGGGQGGDPAVKMVMMRIDKGPDSLNKTLEKQVKADPPAWDAIQSASSEYVKLTTDLTKANPPAKGTKESWDKKTAAFHDLAEALDKAAKARDMPATKEAQAKLGTSCQDCHTEHRSRGPGGRPGGPGGPPMGGGGPPMGGGGPPMGGGGPPMGGKAPMQG